MSSLGSADAKVPPARDKSCLLNCLPPRRRQLGASPPSEGVYALVSYLLYALITQTTINI
jgi:hypothetical protein